ncbi:hypothetical protein AAVH_24959 [Aphelenchoides avenae]|nr:hypothetical protein AAVH_24959 [Aphelenchus avenae]
MLPELRYELLFFCTRDELEYLQPLSQTLLNMIVAGSKVLPLRPIYCVNMDCIGQNTDNADKIHIYVEKPAAGHFFEETVRRLQNVCIKDFNFEILDSAFLRYWVAQETAAFTVVGIELFDRPETKDYGLLDAIVNHLRPRAAQFDVDESSWHNNDDELPSWHKNKDELLKLLNRDSFLRNLQTCRLNVEGVNAFPPSSFIFTKPGYRNYVLRCYRSNTVDGIDGLIECFVRDGCANKKLESVYVRWIERDDGQQSSAPKQLRKPTKVDMALPKNDLTAWITCGVHQVSQCEVHSFVSKKQRKRMEVYKWSVEYERFDRRLTAHVLMCLVKDL